MLDHLLGHIGHIVRPLAEAEFEYGKDDIFNLEVWTTHENSVLGLCYMFYLSKNKNWLPIVDEALKLKKKFQNC